ncbi:DUF5700 domain-containing putative Zn-dependent protease [Ornithinibacillus scapharcae]|uniref:DUF5700 domain-containing putative Zn-dependent protease n=1 Tax=Ornithinibacillus scapharcae TaxID=1147159 RepID=UPI000225BBDC|nr:DUF5700 domain-containing putative Zn-dependent protease [Ornithinibacillus scapharcae]
MQILNTLEAFPTNCTLDSLREYYQKYPSIFDFYFQFHCKNSNERLNQALVKYSNDWPSIEKVQEKIGSLVVKVVQRYKSLYDLDFPISVNLIVGAYGSNGYTNHKIIPDITFALERVTYEEDPLQVLIAHEFGHAAHNIISNNHNMDWKSVQWNHPFTWLLQEGAATHFSRKIIPDLEESIYFSYKYGENEWLEFARNNVQEIIEKFTLDLQRGKPNQEIFKEWFSINGGETFGYSRLGYYIADCLFQDFVRRIGEVQTLRLWKNETFFQEIGNWLTLREEREW